MAKGYFRMDLLGERIATFSALEHELDEVGIPLTNPLLRDISMFSATGDHAPGTRAELVARLHGQEAFGMQWWKTESVDLFCTSARLSRGHSLTFYFDGEIEASVQPVCDALMTHLRDRAASGTAVACCVDFDGIVAQIPTEICQFVGAAGEVPDIYGSKEGVCRSGHDMRAAYHVGDFQMFVLTDRAVPWARRFA